MNVEAIQNMKKTLPLNEVGWERYFTIQNDLFVYLKEAEALDIREFFLEIPDRFERNFKILTHNMSMNEGQVRWLVAESYYCDDYYLLRMFLNLTEFVYEYHFIDRATSVCEINNSPIENLPRLKRTIQSWIREQRNGHDVFLELCETKTEEQENKIREFFENN